MPDKYEHKAKMGGPSGKAKARRVLKGEEARARQADHDKLSTKDKLARLDTRPGSSKRERERLLATKRGTK